MERTSERRLASLGATEALGAEIAGWLRRGDVVTLDGPIGVGKTVLARAIIAALSADQAPDVPSPTFTLVQAYPGLRIPVAHVDLYRVESAEELEELGLEEAMSDGVVLIEWPDRAAGRVPDDRLAVEIFEEEGGARVAVLRGCGAWAPRLRRAEELSDFIRAAGWGEGERRWLKGDASTRSYERISLSGRSAILMNAPGGSDGPPVRGTKPYSTIAHLAEDVRAFIAVDRYLRRLGLSAPEILDGDPDRGFLLLEDLGDELYGTLAERGSDLAGPYEAAIDVLIRLHREDPPDRLPIDTGADYRVPAYDLEAYLIEAELLLDWTWPAAFGAPCPDRERQTFRDIWRDLLSPLVEDRVLVLRDFHSPNLLWLAGRQGAARAGLIDIQDAVIGHPAYDLVSLAEDARVDLPPGWREKLIADYLGRRPGGPGAGPDEGEFRAAMAILGAQRAAKIIGIFTRLAARDGKDAYLAHIPRVRGYLKTNLDDPRLAPLARWFAAHDPLLQQTSAAFAGAA